MVVNTDNAAYMRKAYKEMWKGLFPNSIHITCLAHCANLFGESFKKPFKSVTKFVKNMSAVFWNANGRKMRYLAFLKFTRPDTTPKMPPNPIGTRWNCWYEAVDYHMGHIDLYREFTRKEMEHAKSLAPNSLRDLNQLFSDDHKMLLLKAQMQFIADKSEIFVKATDYFQSQSAISMTVWSRVVYIQYTFHGGIVSLVQIQHYFDESFTSQDKILLQVYDKVEKYMSMEGQPGTQFLKDIQFFDPRKIAFIKFDELSGVPGLSDVPMSEIIRDTENLGPAAVKSSFSGVVDCSLFWKSCSEELPVLSQLALRYIFASVNSADVERSFSLYNVLHSDRRRHLSEESLKQLLFLYFNKFVARDFF